MEIKNALLGIIAAFLVGLAIGGFLTSLSQDALVRQLNSDIERLKNENPVSATPPADEPRSTQPLKPTEKKQRPAYTPRSTTSPLLMMSTVFEGRPSQKEIKSKLDRLMSIHGITINNENYNRTGSVLLELRKSNHKSEMKIMDCMLGLNEPGVRLTFNDAAALCATYE